MILDRSPVSNPLGGLRGWDQNKNSTFSGHSHVAYQIEWNHKRSNMVANILPANPPADPRVGSKGQNIFFSEHDNVAYQIKENHGCSNMVANILPVDPHPRPLGWGQKVRIQLFQNMVMLHIKLNGISNAATW